MYQDRILLTVKDILDKNFKIDTRGFRPQEVDKFLDMVIRDYEEWNNIVSDLEADKNNLLTENMKLKQEMRLLKTKLDVAKEEPAPAPTNADLLRRLSNLEKIIYEKE
ncbi:MAG: cell division regulator GpsB [Bacilli bacterium]|nr:cell division regulator GpsB [Bacilli bacterium]